MWRRFIPACPCARPAGHRSRSCRPRWGGGMPACPAPRPDRSHRRAGLGENRKAASYPPRAPSPLVRGIKAQPEPVGNGTDASVGKSLLSMPPTAANRTSAFRLECSTADQVTEVSRAAKFRLGSQANVNRRKTGPLMGRVPQRINVLSRPTGCRTAESRRIAIVSPDL